MDPTARMHATPLLTAGEETALAALIAEGKAARQRLTDPTISADQRARDEQAIKDATAARERFILANTRLAHHWAARSPLRHLPGVELDDLTAAALDGVITAVDRFNPNAGTKFSTYATHWITQRMQRAARHAYGPTFTHSQVATDNRVSAATRNLTAQHGRPPTTLELADACNLLTSEITESKQRLAARRTASLDAALDDGTATLADLLSTSTLRHPQSGGLDSDLLETHARARIVRTAIGSLSPDQRRIVILGFGLDGHGPRTGAQLVTAAGLDPHRVSELLTSALTALRSNSALTRLVRAA